MFSPALGRGRVAKTRPFPYSQGHMEQLRRALAQLEDGFSHPSLIGNTGVHHGYRQYTLHGDHPFKWLCDAGWVSWIEPGGFVLPHVDAGPWRSRWQMPIETAGVLWYESGYETAEPGRKFQVHHYRPHAVINDTGTRRVHVVWEEGQKQGEATPFSTLDPKMCPRVVPLLQAARGY